MPNDINKRHEAKHLSNINATEDRIKNLFEDTIDSIFKKSGAIRPKADVFSITNYPVLNTAVEAYLKQFHDSMVVEVENGIKDDWELSRLKHIDIVSRTYQGKELSDTVKRIVYDKHESALKQFIEARANGLNLSDRVWNYTNQFRSEIEQGLYTGISQGMSAVRMAQEQKKYLCEPDKLFRRVRDAGGKLKFSKAAQAYKPGRGVYRSSFKNALRMTRNQNNFAYRTADVLRWQATPFVLGYEVKLSNSHPKYDMCDRLAGKYPVSFMFKAWHISCICYSVPMLASPEEFDKYEDAVLNGTEAEHMFSNRVTDVPEGYKAWMLENREKIENGSLKPFWIYDNYMDGRVSKGLSFATAPNKGEPPAGLDLQQMISGDLPTNKEVADVLMAYAENYPDNFRRGLGEVKFQSSMDWMMQHSMYYNPSTGEWTGKSSITLSTYTYDSIGFNPAKEFKSALAAIKAGRDLTYNEEYSIESLWHEILHAKTKTPPRELTNAERKHMETLNQFVARHTYPEFIEALGGKATNQGEILERGYGYTSWIGNFRRELADAGIAEEFALKELIPVLMGDYKKIALEILKFKVKHSK